MHINITTLLQTDKDETNIPINLKTHQIMKETRLSLAQQDFFLTI